MTFDELCELAQRTLPGCVVLVDASTTVRVVLTRNGVPYAPVTCTGPTLAVARDRAGETLTGRVGQRPAVHPGVR